MRAVRLPASSRSTWVVVIAGGALFALAAATGVAQASAGSDALSDPVHACVGNKYGAVRIVSEGTRCGRHQHAVTWNRSGPAGAAGQPGPAGAAGPAGASGPAASDPTPRARDVGTVTITPAEGADGGPVRFPIDSYSAGVAFDSDLSGAGSAGAGTVSVDPFVVDKHVDAASVDLFEWAATGAHFDKVVIDLDAPGTSAGHEKVTLTGARLESVQTKNDGSDTDTLHEQVEFTAVKVDVAVGASSFSLDLASSSGS